MDLVDGVLNGTRIAISRAITAVENEYDEATAIMQKLYPHTGRAHLIGITGPPGAGKSTLTDKVAKEYRRQGKTVGIVAIDPTSPYSGGAILGDRIRMLDISTDEGVFIRSMATRGSLGGLSRKTSDAVKILDAAGKDIIIIETVGVGQSEVDIVKNADTTIVVMVPGLGDDIQAIKAGILEIGDVFAINKADRDGADKLNIELQMMMDLNQDKTLTWRPPVKRTVANLSQGIEELVEAIDGHVVHLHETGELVIRRTERTKNEILATLDERIGRYVLNKLNAAGEFDRMVASVQSREKDPYSLVAEVLAATLR